MSWLATQQGAGAVSSNLAGKRLLAHYGGGTGDAIAELGTQLAVGSTRGVVHALPLGGRGQ